MPYTLPLDEMTLEEKLQAMEDLWEDLSRRPDELESPAWHGEVLRERQRQLDAGETHFIPWDEAQRQIDRLVAQSDNPDTDASEGCFERSSCCGRPPRTLPTHSVFTSGSQRDWDCTSAML